MEAGIACYRCGRQISADRFDRERWVVLDVWSCSARMVCRDCQRPDERPIADDLVLVAEPYCVIEVEKRPATFATAHERPWKEAVREAIARQGIAPRPEACFMVRIDFRTPVPRTVNDRWDLDNLIKPTLDAMEGIFGLRAWAGTPQPNDDKVISLEATKQTVTEGQLEGATISVWLV